MDESDQRRVFDDKTAFRQRIKLAAVQVMGLSSDELRTALAYEVEPFSGIPAAEAEVAFVPVEDPDPSVRAYDLAVVRRRKKGDSFGSVSLERLMRPALAVAVLVVLGVAADWGWLCWQTRRLSRECARRAPLQQRLRQAEAAVRAAQDETARLRAAHAAAEAAQRRFARLRAAFPHVLQTLASVCGGRAVVKELAPGEEPYALTIRAVAPGAQSAAEVMVEMARQLKAQGWSVESGPIDARRDGTTAEFQCRLRLVDGEGAR